MPKLYSCFTANNHNRKKHKQSNEEIDVKAKKAEKVYGYRLLLSGDDESGKTAIIEKMTALCDPFTQQEKIDKIPYIKRYIRDSLSNVLRALDQIIPPVQLEHPENHWRATYILTTAYETDFDYPSEFYEHVTILWADAGVKLGIKRSVERRYLDVAKYFLDRVDNIRYPTYIPSTADMVYCRLFTSDVFKLFFKHQRVGFHLFEMDLRREKQQEWIAYFSDIIGIIFVADCSCFNLIIGDDKSHNRLQYSLELFKTVRQNEWLRTSSVILFLNKQDRLAKKIKHGIRLEGYFPEFTHYVTPKVGIDNFETEEDPKVSQAKYFICDQFLKADMAISGKYHNCYPHFTRDADITVSLIVEDCRSIIVQMHLRQFELL